MALMFKKLPWPEILVTVVVVACGVGVYAWAHRDEGSLEESKRRGELIVDALERYRADAAAYPASLSELVPRYAPEIQAPTWGVARWTYARYSPRDVGGGGAATDTSYFQLSVPANESGYPVLYYDFAAKRWVLNN